jgi:phosphate-selective porin OprO and OprP
VDNRTYLGTGAGSDIDTLVLRRVRPTFSGTIYHYIDFMFRPDFGQGTTAIYDAYAQLNYLSWANLRVGKFKPPVGLERLQNDDDTNFIERGLPTNLGPQRDIGYQLSANLFKQRATMPWASSMACRTPRSAPIPRSATTAITPPACF